jgi:hypothetical protein
VTDRQLSKWQALCEKGTRLTWEGCKRGRMDHAMLILISEVRRLRLVAHAADALLGDYEGYEDMLDAETRAKVMALQEALTNNQPKGD